MSGGGLIDDLAIALFALDCQELPMFFILSKTLGLLLEPLVIPYLCIICAVLAFWRRRRFLGRFFVISAILLPLFYGIIPLSSQPLRFIENHIKNLIDFGIDF